MWREATSFRGAVRASADLLWLEARLMTGGRLGLMVLGQIAWLITCAVIQRFRDEPWDQVSFYNRTVLLPVLLMAIGLGMSCVLSERDIRHLEMSFSTAAGRYQLWSFRLGALGLILLGSCCLLATGTWLAVAREVTPWTAAFHAFIPAACIAVLAAALSLLFNGAATAGLICLGVTAGSGMILHGGGASRFDPFLNPFDPPTSLLDPGAWVRTLTFNRLFLLTMLAVFTAVALGLLQRRERLL